MKIDIHCHFVPGGYLDALRQEGNRYGEALTSDSQGRPAIRMRQGMVYEISPELHDISATLAEMDRMGLDMMALSPPPTVLHYELEGEDIDQHCRVLNEGMAELGERYPDRVAPMGMVPLQDGQRAVAEVERAVSDLGLRAVTICTNINGRNLDDPEFRPFFARARELGVLVFVHPWFVAGADRLRRYHFLNAIGNPFDTTIAVTSLIYAGILEEMPDLKLCFAHGGGAAPFLMGRSDRAFDIRPEAQGFIPKPPSSYLPLIHVDTILHGQEALAHVVRVLGSERVLMGSDCPFHLTDMGDPHPVQTVMDLPIPPEDRDKILGGNAARLLGIAG